MAEYPTNFTYSSGTLSWTNAPDSDWVEVAFTPRGVENWQICYSGDVKSCCPFSHPTGDYSVKGRRRKKGGTPGGYGPDEPIHV